MTNQQRKIRVAQIIGNSASGGVPSFIMNYFRHIDRTRVEFFFYTYSNSHLDEEILSLGGTIVHMPDVRNIFKCLPFLKKSFKENHIDIVHSHMTTLSITPLFAAKLAKIKIRICHSHSTTNIKEKVFLIKTFLKPFACLYATHLVGCGKKSNIWLYGKERGIKAKIIPNAINLSHFKRDESRRELNRKELCLSNKFIVGHIGRFEPQKNHLFLLEAFNKTLERMNNVHLVLVGSGKLEGQVIEKVEMLGMQGQVTFLPEKREVYEYYELFDVFWLPSLYEGLPLVGIEAQAMNLPCLFSDEISKEVDICNCSYFLPIDDIKLWADKTIELADSMPAIDNSNIVKEKGYDISDQANELLSYYNSLL